MAESGAYYFFTYYSPSPPNDGKRHRIKVTTRRTDVEVRAREEYVSPAKPPKAVPAVAPLDALLGSPIQARGLTMRIVAIPAPLDGAPSTAVIVGIELPSAAAGGPAVWISRWQRLIQEGKTRARLRFNTNFTPPTAATPAWTHTGSRLDVAPGRYQIRVAAVGADKTQGSVFTELTVPKFDTELGVGGLSLGAPAPAGSEGPDRLRDRAAVGPVCDPRPRAEFVRPGTTADSRVREGGIHPHRHHHDAVAAGRHDRSTRSGQRGHRGRVREIVGQGVPRGYAAAARAGCLPARRRCLARPDPDQPRGRVSHRPAVANDHRFQRSGPRNFLVLPETRDPTHPIMQSPTYRQLTALECGLLIDRGKFCYAKHVACRPGD